VNNSEKETDLLKLKNYKDHPTVQGVKVFFFRNQEQGNYFETLLIEHKIFYEKDVDQEEGMTFFGIKRNDFERTEKLNYLSFARYRKAFIPNKFFRYFLLIAMLGLIAFALVGYLKSI